MPEDVKAKQHKHEITATTRRQGRQHQSSCTIRGAGLLTEEPSGVSELRDVDLTYTITHLRILGGMLLLRLVRIDGCLLLLWLLFAVIVTHRARYGARQAQPECKSVQRSREGAASTMPLQRCALTWHRCRSLHPMTCRASTSCCFRRTKGTSCPYQECEAILHNSKNQQETFYVAFNSYLCGCKAT